MSLGRQTRDGVAVRRVQVMLDDATVSDAELRAEVGIAD